MPNRTTVEAREAAAEIIDNPIYRANLTERALAGTLSPPIEQMLWHYAKGKPKETIGIEGDLSIGVTAFAAKVERLSREEQIELDDLHVKLGLVAPREGSSG